MGLADRDQRDLAGIAPGQAGRGGNARCGLLPTCVRAGGWLFHARDAIARAMIRRQTLPRKWPCIWLVTDARNDAVLEAALARLPRGSGMIFRHYHLPPDARRARFGELARLARRRGHVVVLRTARATRPANGERTASTDRQRAARARAACLRLRHRAFVARDRRGASARADAVAAVAGLRDALASRARPRSGRCAFACCAACTGEPVVALGGMNAARRRRTGCAAWAAIDGICDEATRSISLRFLTRSHRRAHYGAGLEGTIMATRAISAGRQRTGTELARRASPCRAAQRCELGGARCCSVPWCSWRWRWSAIARPTRRSRPRLAAWCINWMGRPGAWVADLALTLFGPVSMLFLPLLYVFARRLWRLPRKTTARSIRRIPLVASRVACCCSPWRCSATLLSLLFDQARRFAAGIDGWDHRPAWRQGDPMRSPRSCPKRPGAGRSWQPGLTCLGAGAALAGRVFAIDWAAAADAAAAGCKRHALAAGGAAPTLHARSAREERARSRGRGRETPGAAARDHRSRTQRRGRRSLPPRAARATCSRHTSCPASTCSPIRRPHGPEDRQAEPRAQRAPARNRARRFQRQGRDHRGAHRPGRRPCTSSSPPRVSRPAA